jgi:hypothetical protein
MSPSMNRVSGGRETGRRADATAVGRSPCSPHDRSCPLLREMWPAGAFVVRHACRRRRSRAVDALPVRTRADSKRRRRTSTAADRFLDDPAQDGEPSVVVLTGISSAMRFRLSRPPWAARHLRPLRRARGRDPRVRRLRRARPVPLRLSAAGMRNGHRLDACERSAIRCSPPSRSGTAGLHDPGSRVEPDAVGARVRRERLLEAPERPLGGCAA